jgi:hypothetical protein
VRRTRSIATIVSKPSQRPSKGSHTALMAIALEYVIVCFSKIGV